MSKEKRKWTAGEIVSLIRRKYGDSQQYAVFEQVANGTGLYAQSWIDVVSISLWPSDGLLRRAFEVKVSRSDFLAELSNPRKNAWAREFFHEFWFVAPRDVIKEEELPEGCGWMVPQSNGLVRVRAASTKTDPPLDPEFVASLCRSAASETVKARTLFRDDLLAKDPDILRARVYQAGAEEFLSSRGVQASWHDSKEEVIAHLERATLDERVRRDVDQVSGRLEEFQKKMLDFFGAFCEVAHVSLTEVDEAGKYFHRAFGGDEGRDLALGRSKATEYERKTMTYNKSARDEVARVATAQPEATP